VPVASSKAATQSLLGRNQIVQFTVRVEWHCPTKAPPLELVDTSRLAPNALTGGFSKPRVKRIGLAEGTFS
jgi:hypothetical protein